MAIEVRIDRSLILSDGSVHVEYSANNGELSAARSKNGICWPSTEAFEAELAEVNAGNRTMRDSLVILAAAATLGLSGEVKPQGYKVALDPMADIAKAETAKQP